MYKTFLKRLIDLVISFLAIVISSPILFILSVWLYFANKGAGVYFTQERPGKHELKFKIIKFKTMTDEFDSEGNLLADAQRLTKIGKFIRSISLDELPQLINVLIGDMSFVGPRPLLNKYLPLYDDFQKRRHDVRPGITGWAQVNGRNSIPWKRKFELDIEYVDNISFALDVKIIWLTVVKVIKRDGVNQSDERPMLPFDGTN